MSALVFSGWFRHSHWLEPYRQQRCSGGSGHRSHFWWQFQTPRHISAAAGRLHTASVGRAFHPPACRPPGLPAGSPEAGRRESRLKMSKQFIKVYLDQVVSKNNPLSNIPVWPCMQCRNLLQCFFLQASPALENTHTHLSKYLENSSNPHWDHPNQDVTLQATSTLIALPPNSVGGELDPTDLVGGGLVCRPLLEAAFSQRWRKRVTSNWSSIVLMCLRAKRAEFHLAERRIRKTKEQTYLPFVVGRKSESKLPGDVTRWHHLPERVDLRPFPPTTSPLLLLQVRLQVVFGTNQPALNKIGWGGDQTAYVRRECISGFSDSRQVCTCCSPSCR